MGCDIHIVVEKRNTEGVWEAVKGANPDIAWHREYAETNRKRGDIERAEQLEKEATDVESGAKLAEYMKKYPDESASEYEYYAPQVTRNWIYDGRNYALFTMLAGVRASDDFPVISEPKGMPQDASPAAVEYADQYGCDGHSHSYLTLKELRDFDWYQGAKRYGIVTESQYKRLMQGEKPISWCAGVGGPGIKVIDEVTMRDVIKHDWARGMNGLNGYTLYTSASWETVCADSAGEFYTGALPALKELAGDDPESVRIVFFFDN